MLTGDMSKPNESGSVSQFDGNRKVSAGSRSEPGVCGLINPSTKTISTTKVLLEGSWWGGLGNLQSQIP